MRATLSFNGLKECPTISAHFPVGINLPKFKNKNKDRVWNVFKLPVKKPERRSGFFIVNFEHM